MTKITLQGYLEREFYVIRLAASPLAYHVLSADFRATERLLAVDVFSFWWKIFGGD